MTGKPNAFDKIDVKLGRIWSRIGGALFLIIGSAMLLALLGTDDFTFSGYWPMIAGIVLCFLLSWACFRSRGGLLEKLGDTHDRQR